MNARGILITGGTGFIGGHVVRAWLARGAQVHVWSRDAAKARSRIDPRVSIVSALADIPVDAPIDAIVNLAGAQAIGPPWTRARRKVLVDSRVKTTEAVIAWCATRTPRPRVLVSASAIGFYGPGEDEWFDESSPSRPNFQSQLCVARELATHPAEALGIRIVNARFGLVLGADGGILERLGHAAKLGGAAVIGGGRQWMSWIHVDDAIRAVDALIEDENMRGPVNVVGPEPARQRDFQRALARAVRRPLWLRIPGALLTATLGEMAELLTKGQRVAPKRLRDAGFEFRHPALEESLADLLVRRGRS